MYVYIYLYKIDFKKSNIIIRYYIDTSTVNINASSTVSRALTFVVFLRLSCRNTDCLLRSWLVGRCKLPELFILWSDAPLCRSVLLPLRLNQARPPLVSSFSLSPNLLFRSLPLALALAASLRASSCTRRSLPQRRTIRIPISLPAFLTSCGCVRYSCSIRWITCVLDEGWERIRNRRCQH